MAPCAWAQSGGNLPPVAAPTSKVQVDSIPVVRSGIERTGDFISGLLRGLRSDERVQDIAVRVVQNKHRPLHSSSGTLGDNAQFPAGGIQRALYAVAIMQLVESGQLKSDQDVGVLLNGNPSGVLLSNLMTGQGGDTTTIVRVIEKISGKSAGDLVSERIFRPLGMSASQIENGLFRTSIADLERFLDAIVNGGASESGAILQNASVEALEKSAARPGWGFGLPEMRRNGWRALQLDGSAQGSSVRLVIAPDPRLAYLLVVRGRPSGRLWRTLDDAIFDVLLPPRPATTPFAGTQQNAAIARSVAGTYEPDSDLRSLVFLKFPGRDLRVRAGNDGALVLSGAENAILLPASEGGWSSPDGNVSASFRGDELFFSSGVAYRPVAFYDRPLLYALLALVAAIVTMGFVLFGSMPAPRTWFGGRAGGTHELDTSPTHQERSV